MILTWLDLAAATAVALFGSGILVLVMYWLERKARTIADGTENHLTGPVFLFEGKTLIDATPDAKAMMVPHLDHMDEYTAALHVLSPHFPTLADAVEDADSRGMRIDGHGNEGLWLEVNRTGGLLRLAVNGQAGPREVPMAEVIQQDVRLAELVMLRDMTRHSPQLIWQENSEGRLIWANHTYLEFCDRVGATGQGAGTTWPGESLFPDLQDKLQTSAKAVSRVSVGLSQEKAEQWFDVTSVKRPDGAMHFATDANAVVRADHDRRQFVQTLGKTFADLSIGLAIFNKRRELSMFNPALHEMTRLPINFLSQRPQLETVLDKLRETRMLPEPRNYASWREHFTAVEAAAKTGRYTEVWNLPDGQTFRVTGRPHPDGAFAFLFEDISAEVSLTRRFRSDIETSTAVLDTLPDAIAVFSNAGTMVMSNAAYADLWGDVSAEQVVPHELAAAARVWQAKSTATPVWDELQKFIRLLGPRRPWSDRIIMGDGKHMRCHANPIPGGMTMIRFGFAGPAKPVVNKVTAPDMALIAAKR